MHEPKKAGFLLFFHIGQSCRNPVSPSVQPKGLTASLFLRLVFGFSSGWHSFPILVVERVAARINQVVECPAAVMVAKTVVDGFVSDKSIFVCRHDGICLKGFVLLLGICVAKIHNNLRILFAQVKKNALFSSFSVIYREWMHRQFSLRLLRNLFWRCSVLKGDESREGQTCGGHRRNTP